MAEPRCRNDRNRKEKQRFSRLLAVTFSLFRHSPCGGSANATFPRRGKERTAADSPDVAAWLSCRCGGGRPRAGLRPLRRPPKAQKCSPTFVGERFFVLALPYFSGPSPDKYLRHW